MATSSLSVVPPLLQLEPKHQAAMRSLISTVVRSFYEPKFFILMELLAKHHMCGLLAHFVIISCAYYLFLAKFIAFVTTNWLEESA